MTFLLRVSVAVIACWTLSVSADGLETTTEVPEMTSNVLCDRDNITLYEDLDSCFKMEPQVVQDVMEKCALRAWPESGGDQVKFYRHACKHRELFKEHNACFKEIYDADPEFRKLAEVTQEVIKCNNDVFIKHGLEDHTLAYE